MPTYEYECSKCKDLFEMFQGIKAAPVKTCPKCGGKVHRLIGAGGGIIFKGSGFYQTDYKNKSRGGQDSIPSEARDRNKSPRDRGNNKKNKNDNACPKAKSDGCEGCSLNRKKDG